MERNERQQVIEMAIIKKSISMNDYTQLNGRERLQLSSLGVTVSADAPDSDQKRTVTMKEYATMPEDERRNQNITVIKGE